ncbi:MAG: LamG domain-containing protein [Bacteroidetes bacterium]|nr:LamG domain-containing protein [Bacteroidota bacterium]
MKQGASQNNYAGILDNQGTYYSNWSLHGKLNPIQDGYEFSAGNGSSAFSINLPLLVQQWQHVAIVFNQNNHTLKGYIDGALVDSITFSGNIYYDGNQVLSIAKSYWYGTQWLGEIDELQLFNYAMSQSQINSIKTQTASPGASGLIGLYLFEEPSGTVATDLSTGAHDFNFQNNVTRTQPSYVPASNYLFVPTYTWSPSTGLSATNIANPIAHPTSTQTYTVTVSNPASGCISTTTKTVSVTSNPNPTITANGPLTFCSGGSVILDAGAGYNSYLWSNGSTTQTISVSNSGSYSVIATGSGGCTGSSAPVTVSVNNNPTPTITPSGSLTFCQGGSVNLSASSGVAYLWSTGATTQSISVSVSGTYSVTVTSAQGCSGTSNPTAVNVIQPPSVTISPGGPTTFCQGGNVALDAGTHSTYLWSTGATTQTISATSIGWYNVTVSDVGACTANASIFINVLTNPTPAINPTGTITLCTGQQQLLDGPDGYQTYVWSNGQTTEDINVSVAGTYSLTVTDNNGCTGTSAPTIVQTNSSGNATITAGGPLSFCSGDSVLLTANSGTTYLWSTGATTQSIYASVSGSYSVTVSNGSCVGTSSPVSVTVFQKPNPIVSPVGSVSLCQNGNVILSTQSFNGYLWSTGQTSQSIIVTNAGDYSVTVSDSHNCSAISAVTNVVVHPNPTPHITANGPTDFCIGGNVVMDVGNQYSSYAWSNGSTASSITISNTGNYTVTVTDSNGCFSSTNQFVNVAPIFRSYQ